MKLKKIGRSILLGAGILAATGLITGAVLVTVLPAQAKEGKAQAVLSLEEASEKYLVPEGVTMENAVNSSSTWRYGSTELTDSPAVTLAKKYTYTKEDKIQYPHDLEGTDDAKDASKSNHPNGVTFDVGDTTGYYFYLDESLLSKGYHKYKLKLAAGTQIPISKWTIDPERAYECHGIGYDPAQFAVGSNMGYIDPSKWGNWVSYFGVEFHANTYFGSKAENLEGEIDSPCLQDYDFSTWVAYCAFCGEAVTRYPYGASMNFYIPAAAALEMPVLEAGQHIVFTCADCGGVEVSGWLSHTCDALSANRYFVTYDDGTDDPGVTGTMGTDTFYTDFATEYEGETVTNTTRFVKECSYTRPGYTFIGWSTTKGGSVEYKPDDSIKAFQTDASGNYLADGTVTTLYAVWQANTSYFAVDCGTDGASYNGHTKETWKVTYQVLSDADNGDLGSANGFKSFTVAVDTSLIKTPAGFNTVFDAGEGEVNGASTVTIPSTTSFNGFIVNVTNGEWSNARLTYTAGTDNGTESTADSISPKFKQDKITLPDADSGDDTLTFVGWFADPDGEEYVGEAGDSYMPTGEKVTLYAKYSTLNVDIQEVYYLETEEEDPSPDNILKDESGFAENKADGYEPGGSTAVQYATGAVNLSMGLLTPPSYTTIYRSYYRLFEDEKWQKITDLDGANGKGDGSEWSFAESTTFTVPSSGIYSLEALGAQGGSYGNYVGGNGGEAYGYFFLEKGDILTIETGEVGGGGSGTLTKGGGYTKITSEKKGVLVIAGGGGGATTALDGGDGGTSLVSTGTSNGVTGASSTGTSTAGGGSGATAGSYGHSHQCNGTLTTYNSAPATATYGGCYTKTVYTPTKTCTKSWGYSYSTYTGTWIGSCRHCGKSSGSTYRYGTAWIKHSACGTAYSSQNLVACPDCGYFSTSNYFDSVNGGKGASGSTTHTYTSGSSLYGVNCGLSVQASTGGANFINSDALFGDTYDSTAGVNSGNGKVNIQAVSVGLEMGEDGTVSYTGLWMPDLAAPDALVVEKQDGSDGTVTLSWEEPESNGTKYEFYTEVYKLVNGVEIAENAVALAAGYYDEINADGNYVYYYEASELEFTLYYCCNGPSMLNEILYEYDEDSGLYINSNGDIYQIDSNRPGGGNVLDVYTKTDGDTYVNQSGNTYTLEEVQYRLDNNILGSDSGGTGDGSKTCTVTWTVTSTGEPSIVSRQFSCRHCDGTTSKSTVYIEITHSSCGEESSIKYVYVCDNCGYLSDSDILDAYNDGKAESGTATHTYGDADGSGSTPSRDPDASDDYLMLLQTSDVVSKTLTSAIAGYYYKCDDNDSEAEDYLRLLLDADNSSSPYTWSDLNLSQSKDVNFTQDTTITVDPGNYHYIHLAAVDVAGNVGATTTVQVARTKTALVTFNTNKLEYTLDYTTVSYGTYDYSAKVSAYGANAQNAYYQRYFALDGSSIADTGFGLFNGNTVSFGGDFPTVTAAGCEFLGWNDKADGTGTWYSAFGAEENGSTDDTVDPGIVVEGSVVDNSGDAEPVGTPKLSGSIAGDDTVDSSTTTNNTDKTYTSGTGKTAGDPKELVISDITGSRDDGQEFTLYAIWKDLASAELYIQYNKPNLNADTGYTLASGIPMDSDASQKYIYSKQDEDGEVTTSELTASSWVNNFVIRVGGKSTATGLYSAGLKINTDTLGIFFGSLSGKDLSVYTKPSLFGSTGQLYGYNEELGYAPYLVGGISSKEFANAYSSSEKSLYLASGLNVDSEGQITDGSALGLIQGTYELNLTTMSRTSGLTPTGENEDTSVQGTYGTASTDTLTLRVDATAPEILKYKVLQDRLDRYSAAELESLLSSGKEFLTSVSVTVSDYNDEENGVFTSSSDSSGIYGVYLSVVDMDDTSVFKCYKMTCTSVTATTDNDGNILAGTYEVSANLYTDMPNSSKLFYRIYVVDNAGNISAPLDNIVNKDDSSSPYPEGDVVQNTPIGNKQAMGVLYNYSVKTVVHNVEVDSNGRTYEDMINQMNALNGITTGDDEKYFKVGERGIVEVWTIGYIDSIQFNFSGATKETYSPGTESRTEILNGLLDKKYNLGLTEFGDDWTRTLSYTQADELRVPLTVYDAENGYFTLSDGEKKYGISYNDAFYNASGVPYASHYYVTGWGNDGTSIRIPPYYELKETGKYNTDGTPIYEPEYWTYEVDGYKGAYYYQTTGGYYIYSNVLTEVHYRDNHES